MGDRPLLVQGAETWRQPTPSRERQRSGDDDRRGDRRSPSRTGGSRLDASTPPDADMERFRIEVGWQDRVKPGNIVGAIANEAGLNGRSIGRIQIFDTHSTVDLPSGMPEDVFNALRRLRVMNKELQITRHNS